MSSAGQLLEAGRIPGERIATDIEVADSSTFTAETVIMSVTAPLVDGRTYGVWALFRLKSSVDNDDVTGRIRQDSVSGGTLQEDGMELSHDLQGTRGQGMVLYGEYTASATANKTFVLTGERAAGTGNISMEASANKPSYLFVEYVSG